MSVSIIEESATQIKSFPQTYIYSMVQKSGQSIERPMIDYIMTAERINKMSPSFAGIQNEIKTRQTSAILYKVLMMPDVILAMSNTKEMPASFKVFRASDVRAADKKPRIFIDLTGIVKLNGANLVCSKIDTLITYLMGALVQMLYYDDSRRLVTNASVTRPATVCFVRLFTGVLDELRVLGYAENQIKIKYITAVYFLTNLLSKPLSQAQSMAANIMSISPKEAKAFDFFYDEESLTNLDTFISGLVESFKLQGLSTDIMIDKWGFKYGKGTVYGLELYPSFLMILTNAYCGAYVNNQKTIEKFCGKDMVTVSTTIIRMGADIYMESAMFRRDKDTGEILMN